MIARSQAERARHIAIAQKGYDRVQHIDYTPDPEVIRLYQTAHVLEVTGFVFFVFCIGFLVIAAVRHEPGWYLMAILLLFFDFVASMLL